MIWGLLLETMLISMSGVMAPGPISAVTVGKGAESPHAGGLVAIGHGIVEIPLIILIAYGFGAVFEIPAVSIAIGLAGGVLLAIMGIGMLRNLRSVELAGQASQRSPVVSGILLTASSPYFLVWWATVGATLISRSYEHGVWVLAAFGAVHWLCDLGWCYMLSMVSYHGGKILGRRFQQAIFAVSGVFLVFFAAKFIVESAQKLMA